MLKKIGLGVGVLVLGVLGYAAIKPSEFFISRELVIQSSPNAIFPYINSSKVSHEWMPWKDSDPSVQMQFSGPDYGLGSKATWDGKGKMGTGSAEVVESIVDKSVKTQLTYTKPMVMSQLAEVSLTPTEQGTVVKWSVSGKSSFVGRLFCLFMNMDKMVGGEFEKGLGRLKTLVENKGK